MIWLLLVASLAALAVGVVIRRRPVVRPAKVRDGVAEANHAFLEQRFAQRQRECLQALSSAALRDSIPWTTEKLEECNTISVNSCRRQDTRNAAPYPQLDS